MATIPIKRSQHIVQLSKDHHFALLFCWKIRQGLRMHIATERLRNYISYFSKEHLEPHFQQEELLLFKPIGDEKVEKALNDHKKIRDHIALVLDPLNKNDFELISKLTDIVEAHVRYEERELFPHLEKVLAEEQLQSISEELNREPITQDNHEDEFWVAKKH